MTFTPCRQCETPVSCEFAGCDYTPPVPTGEVRVVNAQTGGEKGSKPERFDLIPGAALADVARVYAFGASKYADHNWMRGYAWSLSYAALVRHLVAFWEGEDCDPESGLPHLAHAGFHVLALLTYLANPDAYGELDDRPPAPGSIPAPDAGPAAPEAELPIPPAHGGYPGRLNMSGDRPQ